MANISLTDAGDQAGLEAAVEVFADSVRFTAERLPSKKIPPTVKGFVRAKVGYVQAGGQGGKQAPNAAMFETPGARHPLFAKGPRGTDGWKHWYDQPFRPFMEEAVVAALDEAADVYADTAIAVWMAESG
jgi:hypothetical protein